MLDVFPSIPPSLKIEDYFCEVCGGLHHLPAQLIFEPVMLRWCICHWSILQQFFARAADYYAGMDDEKEKTEVGDSPLWIIENRAKEPA